MAVDLFHMSPAASCYPHDPRREQAGHNITGFLSAMDSFVLFPSIRSTPYEQDTPESFASRTIAGFILTRATIKVDKKRLKGKRWRCNGPITWGCHRRLGDLDAV